MAKSFSLELISIGKYRVMQDNKPTEFKSGTWDEAMDFITKAGEIIISNVKVKRKFSPLTNKKLQALYQEYKTDPAVTILSLAHDNNIQYKKLHEAFAKQSDYAQTRRGQVKKVDKFDAKEIELFYNDFKAGKSLKKIVHEYELGISTNQLSKLINQQYSNYHKKETKPLPSLDSMFDLYVNRKTPKEIAKELATSPVTVMRELKNHPKYLVQKASNEIFWEEIRKSREQTDNLTKMMKNVDILWQALKNGKLAWEATARELKIKHKILEDFLTNQDWGQFEQYKEDWKFNNSIGLSKQQVEYAYSLYRCSEHNTLISVLKDMEIDREFKKCSAALSEVFRRCYGDEYLEIANARNKFIKKTQLSQMEEIKFEEVK